MRTVQNRDYQLFKSLAIVTDTMKGNFPTDSEGLGRSLLTFQAPGVAGPWVRLFVFWGNLWNNPIKSESVQSNNIHLYFRYQGLQLSKSKQTV